MCSTYVVTSLRARLDIKLSLLVRRGYFTGPVPIHYVQSKILWRQ
jgi:hypothetical protein